MHYYWGCARTGTTSLISCGILHRPLKDFSSTHKLHKCLIWLASVFSFVIRLHCTVRQEQGEQICCHTTWQSPYCLDFPHWHQQILCLSCQGFHFQADNQPSNSHPALLLRHCVTNEEKCFCRYLGFNTSLPRFYFPHSYLHSLKITKDSWGITAATNC